MLNDATPTPTPGPARPGRHIRHLRALYRDIGAARELVRTGQIDSALSALDAAREQLARRPGVLQEKKP